MLDLRGRYSTALEAMRLVDNNLERYAADRFIAFGWREVKPLQAQRGDVVMTLLDSKATLGICLGSKVAFIGEVGFFFFPLHSCTRAWRIE